MMTTEQIAGLAALLDAATPGPWGIPGQPDKICSDGYTKSGAAKTIATVATPAWMNDAEPWANAALIAIAPDLAAEVLRLTATVADLTAAFGDTHAPAEPGGFVGDIYFGDDNNSTRGTHRWDGQGWHRLPTDADALCQLLAKERATVADLTSANTALAAECARLKAREVDARAVILSLLDWLPPKSAPKAIRAARAYLAGGAE